MDYLKDWWTSWSMDWPFLKITGKAENFDRDYRGTLPAFFRDLESTPPELRKRYYDPELYEVLMTMVCHRDADSIRRLFALCPGWNGQGGTEGLTPLGQALDNRDWDCAALLLEQGADPELYDQTTTALEAAVWDGLGAEFYRLILSHGGIFTQNALLTLAESPEREQLAGLLGQAKLWEHGALPALLAAAVSQAEESPEDYSQETVAFLRNLSARLGHEKI